MSGRHGLGPGAESAAGAALCHPPRMSSSVVGQDSISPMLRPGERVLWHGQPDVKAYSLRGAWYLVPFSLLWGGFAIFWEISAVRAGAGLFFGLWGIPFVAVGLYLIFGRILVARREARRTHYAVTDQRVIILAGAFSRRTTEMALGDLPPAQLDEGSRGIGTITFGAAISGFRAPPGWPMTGMYTQSPAFMSIPDAARVYRVVQDAKDAARRHG
jgi:hypothetical protein